MTLPQAHTTRNGAHPLEMIPGLRRWPPSPLRNLLYTLVWNSLIATVFTIIAMLLQGNITAWGRTWWISLVFANCIGLLIHAVLLAVEKFSDGWPGRASGWARRGYFFLVLTLCGGLGSLLGMAILTARNPLQLAQDGNLLIRILSTTLMIALVMFAILMAQQKRMRAQALAAQQREQIATSQALLLEAQLRTLQAQIEPHFLFNTLANCLSLMQTQPAQAQHMLEQLIEFLRASLAASRAEQATVGSEIDLMCTYLDLMQLRMGQRLRYQIQVDANIRHLPLLPMLLQPLLENAITHGLEPKLEGGQIIITAKREQDCLLMTIEDDGVGINPNHRVAARSHAHADKGSGMGNHNVRQRIASAYGQKGQIQWLERPQQAGGGVCVELRLPLK